MAEQDDEQRKAARQEMLARLAPIVQHAANNMLTVMSGTADILRRTAKDAPGLARAERIAEAANRMERLLRGYLTFARRTVPDAAAADPALLVTRLAPMLEMLLHGVTRLEVEAPSGLPRVAPDFAALDTALVALVIETAPRLGPVLRLALAPAPEGVTLRIEGLPADAPVAALEAVARAVGGTALARPDALILTLPAARG